MSRPVVQLRLVLDAGTSPARRRTELCRRRHARATPRKRHPTRLENGVDGRRGPDGEGCPVLLRLRVSLPDRPGTLGQVARTLGIVGADIVQVLVLERAGGRAVDDFTVVWPAAGPVDRVLAGLAAVTGVRVDGVWRATELPDPSGREVAIVGQMAANPGYGLTTLVDAAPGVCAADWAAVLSVPADWAAGSRVPPD